MKKTFLRKLFVCVYFVVISIIPLSNLHVECQPQMNHVIADGSDDGGSGFLDILHGLLFSHFGNSAEHIGKSLPVAGGPKISRSRVTEHGVSYDVYYKAENFIFSLLTDYEYAIVLKERSGPCECLHSSFSGLSPPSPSVS